MAGVPGQGRLKAFVGHIGQDVSDEIAFPLMLKRFERKTTIDPVTGCWNWVGPFGPNGYGQASFRNKKYPAHRLMYIIAKGPPGALMVMHSCDVRSCVNPAHLSLGTCEENIHDALRKGRPHRGTLESKKTHCPAGHPYAEFARWDKGRRNILKRSCTVCQRIIQRVKAGWPAALLNLPPQKLGCRPFANDYRAAQKATAQQRSGDANG